MRREYLRPDAHGRVALGDLGFGDEVVVAEEVEPGTWRLRAEHAVRDEPAPDAPTDPARAEEQDSGFVAASEPTVSFGRSGANVQRPASAPPPGPRRNG